MLDLAHYTEQYRSFNRKADEVLGAGRRETQIIDHHTAVDFDVSADTGKPQKKTFFASDSDPFDLSIEPKWDNGRLGNGALVGIYSQALEINNPLIATATTAEKVSAEAIVGQGDVILEIGGEKMAITKARAMITGGPSLGVYADDAATELFYTRREPPDDVHKLVYPTPRLVSPGQEIAQWIEVDGSLFAAAPVAVNDDFEVRLNSHLFVARK